MNLFKIRLALLGAAAFAALPASANLLLNGSFETPDIALTAEYNNGQTIDDAWHVADSNSGVYLIDNDYAGGGPLWPETPFGSQFSYLNNHVDTGRIFQEVQVVGGSLYELSFWQANFASAYASPDALVVVDILNAADDSALGGAQTFTAGLLNPFIRQSLSFTPASTGLYRVSFAAVSGHAGLIDNLALEAVPEPASLAALGLGALALLRRRRVALGL